MFEVSTSEGQSLSSVTLPLLYFLPVRRPYLAISSILCVC